MYEVQTSCDAQYREDQEEFCQRSELQLPAEGCFSTGHPVFMAALSMQQIWDVTKAPTMLLIGT